MTDTLNAPETLEVFTPENIAEIRRVRRIFHEQLVAEDRTIKHFLAYIVYERGLLTVIKRREMQRIVRYPIVSAGVLRKMEAAYHTATKLFPTEDRLWDQYLVFSELEIRKVASTRQLIRRMVLLNGKKPTTWLKAVRWERANQSTADDEISLNKLAWQAFTEHDDYLPIFLELLAITLSARAPEAVRLSRALTAYSKLNRMVLTFNEMVEVMQQAMLHSFTGRLEQTILKDMRMFHQTLPRFWHLLAVRELEGRVTFDGVPEVLPQRFDRILPFAMQNMRMQKCNDVYVEAVSRLNVPEMWMFYLNTMLAIFLRGPGEGESQSHGGTYRRREQFIVSAYHAAEKRGHIDVQHYRQFVEMMYNHTTPTEEIGAILQRAVERNLDSTIIWTMYIKHLARFDEFDVLKAEFARARRTPQLKDTQPLWDVYVNYLRTDADMRAELVECYEEALAMPDAAFHRLKRDYMEYEYSLNGMPAVRAIFVRLCRTKNVTMELYELYYKWEGRQAAPDVATWREVNDGVLTQLGPHSYKIFMLALLFERTHGSMQGQHTLIARAAKVLRARAFTNLTHDLTTMFAFT